MYYRVRFITKSLAYHELDVLGFPNPKPNVIIPEGLLGDADVSKLYFAGGFVYEFEFRGGEIRAYLHSLEDIKELEAYQNYA